MKLFRRKDSDFTIMRATDEDIGPCAEMMAKAIGDQPINRELLEQTLKTPNIIVLIAKMKGKMVGMISGIALPSMIPPPRIDFLGVSDEESARRGLYSMLIDVFIEEVKRCLPNAKYIDTHVPAANYQIVATYSFKGFVVTGFTKGEPPFSDIIVLRKSLPKETSIGYTV